jgi:proteasome accessory factor C
MAKMTGPIQEVSRLLDLVPYLSTHSYISIKELAAEFSVSEREISNELMALSMCGLPGYTDYELIDVSFDSGFVTIRNHDALDIPRSLTNLEAATLLIGLEIMRDGIDSDKGDLVEKIDSLISQISPLVGSALAVESHPEALNTVRLQEAIAQRHAIEISYESALDGEIQSRVIEPLSIYFENSHTYLNAYCHKAMGYRNFRIDRISEVSMSSSPIQEKASASHSVEREEFTLRVTGRPRSVAEFLQVDLIGADGKVKVEAFSREWIAKAVTSFAPDVKLEDPGDFQVEIAGRLKNILALYRS